MRVAYMLLGPDVPVDSETEKKLIFYMRERKMGNNIPVIDVCGKRTIEYVFDCLASFNRGINTINLRGAGSNISKAVEVAEILQKEAGIKVENSEIGSFPVHNGDDYVDISLIEITLNGDEIEVNSNDSSFILPKSAYIDYPIYHLLFDWQLFKNKELKFFVDTQLITIIEQDGTIKYQRDVSKEKNEYEEIRDVFYRCGLLHPANWRKIAKKISEFDDVILGIDTNILYSCSISEHLLPTLSLINRNEYVHTPNWILFVIPSAVMHELEEAANIRDDKGKLQKIGRMGFRALQEIIELSQSPDITGVALVIVGEANPILYTRIELQGLRQDFYWRSQGNVKSRGSESPPRPRLRKTSSGDMIIRDEFKKFLKQIDFHKGIFFLTSDKSNTALAQAEGLHPIYFKQPYAKYESTDQFEEFELKPKGNQKEISMRVPIGKLIYEMAVQFGAVKIKNGSDEILIQCDNKGDNLDYWIHRNLMIEKSDFNKLTRNYEGKLDLGDIMCLWEGFKKKFQWLEEV